MPPNHVPSKENKMIMDTNKTNDLYLSRVSLFQRKNKRFSGKKENIANISIVVCIRCKCRLTLQFRKKEIWPSIDWNLLKYLEIQFGRNESPPVLYINGNILILNI